LALVLATVEQEERAGVRAHRRAGLKGSHGNPCASPAHALYVKGHPCWRGKRAGPPIEHHGGVELDLVAGGRLNVAYGNR
jgi:hypothetical protein